MKKLLFLRAVFACVLAGIVAGAAGALRADEKKPLDLGDPAPDFTFVDFENKEHKLSEFRGKNVLLDFWATWCGPCIGEIPTLRAVHEELKDKNFVVLSVSIDKSVETAKKYVAKNKMPWTQGWVKGAWKSEPVKKYGIEGIPSMWLIDEDGKIKASDLCGEEAKTAARLLLAGKLEFVRDSDVKVTGVVVDDAGKPIAGAKVYVSAYRPGDVAKGLLERSIGGEFFTTDENGVWTCDKMFAGSQNISIGGYHYDYNSGSGSFDLQEFGTEGKKSTDDFYAGKTKIVLQQGMRVSGIVKNSDGKPMPGVLVILGGGGESTNEIPPRKTDEQGRFCYTIGNWYKVPLGVKLKGYAPEWKEYSLLEAKTGVEIILKPAKTITGIIVNEKGEPLPNNWICVDGWREQCWMLGGNVFHSDKNGRFEFKDAPEDEVYFGFEREGYMSLRDFPLKAGAENKIVMIPPTKVVCTIIDADSGEPVKNYEVDRGAVFPERHSPTQEYVSWGGNRRGYYGYSELKQKRDGTFSNEFHRSAKAYLYRISAPGYYTADSERIVPDGKTHEITVKLKKGTALRIPIKGADGNAVNDASIVFVTFEGRFPPFVTIENGRCEESWYSEPERNFMKTDSAGVLTIPPCDKAFRLMIGHPTGGWANVSSKDLTSGKPVVLSPWERITGRAFAGTKPNAGAKVTYRSLSRLISCDGAQEKTEGMCWNASAVADEKGFFEIKNAVPKLGWIRDESLTNRAEQIYIPAGKGASNVRLGGIGRPVIGKIIVSPELDKRMDQAGGGDIRWVEDEQASELPEKPEDDVWEPGTDERGDKGLTPEQKDQRDLRWHKADKKTRHQDFFINPDRTFRIENVMPGKYGVEFGLGYIRGRRVVEIVLDAGKECMDEAQDIGEIVLTDIEKNKVGEPMSDVIFKDDSGKTRRLSEYKEKYVLVYFWQAKYHSTREELPGLQALGEKYKDNGDFVILRINADKNPALARRYIKEKNVPGSHGFWSEENTLKLDDWDSEIGTGSVWLLGPDGNVLKKHLYGELIEEAVHEALGK